MSFLISDALANTPTTSPDGGIMPILFLIGMFAIMYLFMIRPQMKRQKAHKKLVEGLARGDEVQTMGGLMGKISAVDESFIKLEIAENTVVVVRRSAVESVMPKGTLD